VEFLTRLEPSDQPLTGPEHAHRAHLLLAETDSWERDMDYESDTALVGAIMLLAARVEALTHAQLATAATSTGHIIGASSRLRRAWANMFDPGSSFADHPPHPGEE
jgi:hypothetical protein